MNVGLYGLGVKLAGWCGVRIANTLTVALTKMENCFLNVLAGFMAEQVKMIFVVMENEKMDDLISRQAAIDGLEERLQANGYSNAALVSELNRSIGYLMRLPSADVQPVRHGRWERRGYALWTCNLCGCRAARSNPLKGSIWNYNYCPNCGARMDGEQA